MQPQTQNTVLIALAAAAAFALPAAAQTAAGAESNVALAHTLVSSGDASSTVNHDAYATLGQTLAGVESTSTNYALQSGVAWIKPQITSNEPIVFAAATPGDKDGNENVNIFGYNFLAPGAGNLTVDFGSTMSPATLVTTNTVATTVTPPGLGPLGNPIGDTPVTVTNLHGSHTAEKAFTYLPAMLVDTIATPGGRLEMRLQTHPGDVYFLVMGKSSPGIGATLNPWDGKIEILFNVQLLQALVPVPHGPSLFQLDIPNDPVLGGGVLQFQALSVTSFATNTGSFTNLLKVTIVP